MTSHTPTQGYFLELGQEETPYGFLKRVKVVRRDDWCAVVDVPMNEAARMLMSHDDLMLALERIAATDGGDVHELLDNCIGTARAALAKAKGE